MRSSSFLLGGAFVFVSLFAFPGTGCGGSDSGVEASPGEGAGAFGGGSAGTGASGGTVSGKGGSGGSGTGGAKGGAAGSGDAGGGVTGGGAGTSAGAGGAALACPPSSLPSLQACSLAKKSACTECLCKDCQTAWTDCVNDPGCSKAVACSATGCPLEQCATLAPGDSLAKAFAVKACSDASCQSLCSPGSGGTGGSGGASGASGTGGSAGATAGTGGTSGKGGASGTGGTGGTGGASGKGGAAGSSGTGGASGKGGTGGTSGTGGASGKGGTGGSAGKECIPACSNGEVCNPASGLCGECLVAKDCADSAYGFACLGTSDFPLSCGCATSTDCKAHPGGPTCDGFNNVCTCSVSDQCAASPYGKACVDVQLDNGVKTTQCGCTKDTDCKSGQTCAVLFKLCQ